MIRGVFLSDIDGTLVRGEIGMTPGVLAAADAFKAAGGALAVCTGRAPVSAEPVARALGVNAPCILYGGAALYDFERRECLWSRPFPPGVLDCVRLVLERCPGVSMQVLTAERIYVLRRNRRLDERGVKAENQGRARALEEVEGEVLKLVMCGDDVDELESCRDCFAGLGCQFAFASRNFVDVVAGGAGKENAMQALSLRLGVPLGRFFCAGDGMTDLPMLRLAGTSYATANALEPVRAAVTMVVPDVKDGGMELAFRHAANMISEV